MKKDMPQLKGFTLLEILIATGIFMIVMVIGVGIFTMNVSSSSISEQMRVTSQSARFAFESLTRDIRLAHGLVYVSGSAPIMVIPPFEVVSDYADPTQKTIRVYRAEIASRTAEGVAKYKLNRRIYARDITTSQLTLQTQQAYATADTALTAAQLYAKVTERDAANLEKGLDGGIDWQQVAQIQPILPVDLIADQFRVVRASSYPSTGSQVDQLTVQPFIQLDLTVVNPRYNANKDDPQKIKTTFRTMIVPRNFLSPFEVVQSGVQGATE